MKGHQPSNTYRFLYNNIIGQLFYQICHSDINYCVRDEEIPFLIEEKIEEYESRAKQNMSGNRLDRHKLASCICGAIIETKPLTGFRGAKIVKNANEKFALHVGLNVLKIYMIYDLLMNSDLSFSAKEDAKKFLQQNFDMRLPSLEENICDVQEYEENLYNALYWSHHVCEFKSDECFKYDIWAYSKIFYHLELYNQSYLKSAFDKYIKQN